MEERASVSRFLTELVNHRSHSGWCAGYQLLLFILPTAFPTSLLRLQLLPACLPNRL